MPSLSTSVNEAVTKLKQGALVALPTETVYGLAADAENRAAVRAVFALKGRPAHNPLIVHVSDVAMAKCYAKWNNLAEQLAAKYWPGPLTLVLPRLDHGCVAPEVLAGGDTIALRMPGHSLTRMVISRFGRGIAAPSANRSGGVSPTCAAHVMAEFPGADLLVLDGGPCEIGLESTVVDCTGVQPAALRPGSIVIAPSGAPASRHSGVLKAPGQLASHYAPSLPVRLRATFVAPAEALLAFGPNPLQGANAMQNLSESGNLDEAARNMYAMLRALDKQCYRAIAVMPIPDTGIGIAINDRLRRAALEKSKDAD